MSQAVAADAAMSYRKPGVLWPDLPLAVFPEGSDPLSSRRQTQWIWALLAIGLAARVVRYLLRFPLWEDEAMLSTNYFERGYLGLLEPLNYCQVAPPLFLWAQLTVVKVLGFTEYSLRLIPFICGIGSLVLFPYFAGRLLKGSALVLAVGIFAVSYPGIRYASEAKPYGCDLFISLVMLVLLVEWLRRPQQSRWLWALAAVVGPAVGYSFPAVFVGGAISLILAWILWNGRVPKQGQAPCSNPFSAELRSRSSEPVPVLVHGWLPWIAYNVMLLASFAALVLVTRVVVGDEVQQQMVELHWSDTFPPLRDPLRLLPWLISIHAGGLLAYPVGGGNGGSTLTLIWCVAGVALFCRQRRWLLLGVFLLPLMLNFVAACFRHYPYGGHVRMALFMAPAFCTLAGLGIAALVAWIATRAAHARVVLSSVLGIFMLLAAGSLGRDLTHPYKSGTTLRARDFAQWFWFDLSHNAELVCLETDLKQNLSPGTFEYGWSALYLCNQRIYSPRHARGEPPHWDRISTDWPLRCALFRSSTMERDHQALDGWLRSMQPRYTLVAHDKYPVPIYDKWEKDLRTVDYVEVFKFVPGNSSVAAK